MQAFVILQLTSGVCDPVFEQLVLHQLGSTHGFELAYFQRNPVSLFFFLAECFLRGRFGSHSLTKWCLKKSVVFTLTQSRWT